MAPIDGAAARQSRVASPPPCKPQSSKPVSQKPSVKENRATNVGREASSETVKPRSGQVEGGQDACRPTSAETRAPARVARLVRYAATTLGLVLVSIGLFMLASEVTPEQAQYLHMVYSHASTGIQLPILIMSTTVLVLLAAGGFRRSRLRGKEHTAQVREKAA
mmetsp:Transcript_80143/g.180811  ORF Transcript_80143/g.180811 Transcript_80143/m.180811 type:complete len:164 (-) Transcript_80143:271-762(-)